MLKAQTKEVFPTGARSTEAENLRLLEEVNEAERLMEEAEVEEKRRRREHSDAPRAGIGRPRLAVPESTANWPRERCPEMMEAGCSGETVESNARVRLRGSCLWIEAGAC